MKNDVAQLVSVTYTEDSIGQRIPTETEKTVFCKYDSVSSSEWFDAGRNGLKAAYRLTVRMDEYSGETIVKFKDKRYGVYRTYESGRDSIELYLEEKSGI